MPQRKINLTLPRSWNERSTEQLVGRTSQNKAVVFARGAHRPGDLVRVRVTDATSATLLAEPV